MKENLYNPEDDIASLATPWGESALAVLRLSGPECIAKAARLFSFPGKMTQTKKRELMYGFLHDPETKLQLDEVMLSVFRNPSSYTGQDMVEISCHGSLPGIQKILDTLFRNGFRQASPGEFTFRAYLNRKMDLTRAEAVQELISSRSRKAQGLALNRLSGALEREINSIKENLTMTAAEAALYLDYPDDETEHPGINQEPVKKARINIRRLLDTYQAGKIYQQGLKVVLAGKTNAGKSSLFNLFLKEDRSIVSGIHGTTRDYLESWISLAGIPIRLFDTAGLRISNDPVEQEGIKRAEQIVEEADILIYLTDGTKELSEEDKKRLSTYEDKKLIRLQTKSDIADQKKPEGFIALSAVTGEGFAELESEVKRLAFLSGEDISEENAVIDSLRQKQLLEKAEEAIIRFEQGQSEDMPVDILAEDIRDALDALGELTGEVSPSDILDTMFSRFCVGK